MNKIKTFLLLGFVLLAPMLLAQINYQLKISESEGFFTSHQFHEGTYKNEAYYYVGEFWRDIYFDDFAASISDSEDSQDAFVLRMDQTTNYEAFFHLSGGGYERIEDIAVKENGEMWWIGFFNQGLRYDTVNVGATGFYDAFLIRTNAAGDLLDFFHFPGEDGFSAINFDALEMDSEGNLWILANFSGSFALGGNLYEAGFSQDGLLIHLDKNGILLDVHHFATAEAEEHFAYLNDLAIDDADNVIIGGLMTGEVTLDGNPIDLSPNSTSQPFLMKLNAESEIQWLEIYEAAKAAVNTLSIGEHNSIIAGVQFQTSFDFNGEMIEGSGSFAEMAVISVDKDGLPLWHNVFFE